MGTTALHDLLTGPSRRTKPKVLMTPGVHNGRLYTLANLREFAVNFAETKGKRMPSLSLLLTADRFGKASLGHDNDAATADALGIPLNSDGNPRLGDLAEVWLLEETEELMGVFGDVPEPVAALIDAGKITEVSITHPLKYHDTDAGKYRNFMIWDVAFIAKDFPGVLDQGEPLAMVHTVKLDDGEEIEAVVVTFSENEEVAEDVTEDKEGEDMELKELLAKVGCDSADAIATKMTAQGELIGNLFKVFGDDVDGLDGATAKMTELTENVSTLTAKVAEFDAASAERDKAEADADAEARETKLTSTLETCVAEKRIAPFEVDGIRKDAAKQGFTEAVKFTVGTDEVDGTEHDEFCARLTQRPVIGKLTEQSEATSEGDAEAQATAEMTPDEIEHADGMGTSHADWVKNRD